jgi:hypothetical protein
MNCDSAGVTQLGAFETIIADNDVLYIAVLEYHAGHTDRDTFAAIGAFFIDYDIGAVITTIDCALGANLHTFAALCADSGFVYSRLREMGLDFQAGLFRIYFIIMADSTNLHAQTASGAFGR